MTNSAISGRLFWDDDGDNTELAAGGGVERGIAGQTVVLTDDYGNEIAKTTTEDDGSYSFEGLEDGVYCVHVPTEVDGQGLVEKDVGDYRYDSDADPSSGFSGGVTVMMGEKKNIDFGYESDGNGGGGNAGPVDGEDSGELMELGYDDSNAPTDQGGDVITDGGDTIFGNGGDDTIDGEGGDDTIFGDGNSDTGGGETVRESFNWSELDGGNIQTGDEIGNVTQNTGNVDVTFQVLSSTAGTQNTFEGDNPDFIDGIDGGDEDVNPDSSFLSNLAENEEGEGDYAFSFGSPVENVDFRINDIDGSGSVTILAYDENGDPVPVTLTPGASLTVAGGNTVNMMDDALGNYAEESDPNYSVLVEIAGPVSRIEINHTEGEFNSGVTFTDVHFDAITDVDPNAPGDDIIEGNDGDDVTFGDDGTGFGDLTVDELIADQDGAGGDDTFIGGLGADQSWGEGGDDTIIIDSAEDGAGDIIVAGNGPDDTTDNDVLDLRGAGPVTIDATDDATDDGALTGTVTFEDGSTLTFFQVETILTDPPGDNEDPNAVDDVITVDSGTPTTFNPTANDNDPDGDPIEVTEIGEPENGTLVDNGNGTYTYTPDDGFTGTENITYTIDDGNGGSDEGTITFNVGGPAGPGPVDGEETGEEMLPGYDDANAPTNQGGDQIDGDDGDDDTIFGNGGDDTIDSGVGDDSVEGNDGDDTFILTDDADNIDNDTIVGGEGDEDGVGDVIDASDFEDDLTVDITAPEEGTITDGEDTVEFEEIERIITGAGDDTVTGSDGDDYVQTNGGDDIMEGGDGNDTLLSGDGEDTVNGGDGDDSLLGGDEADTINGDGGNDSIDGGRGPDLLDGGAGDDTILGGNDDDDIFGGDGSDSIDAGNGDNFIDASGSNDLVDDKNGDGFGFGPYGPLPGVPADDDPNDDRDFVTAGQGDDTIFTGDDADTIVANGGNDVIDSGIDNDDIDGGSGDDTITSGEGADIVFGNGGNDVIYGGLGPSFPDAINIPNEGAFPDGGDPDLVNGADLLDGGNGNDLIYGEDDDDTLIGGNGADTLYGGVDNDSMEGGVGQDDLHGGQGADTMIGGADRDEFFFETREEAFGDLADGSTEGNDIDTLHLGGLGPWEIVNETDDADGDSTSGTINFLNDDGSIAGSMDFTEIERIICFTPGARIATPRGEINVEDLHVGDRVITRDDGVQEINWIGKKKLSAQDLVANPKLRPVLIKKGALGNNLPERDMMVSPNHRMLVANSQTQVLFDEREVLVAAKHLIGQPGVHQIDTLGTEFIHVMFERHEVILGDGAWTESFQPGDHSLSGIDAEQRDEIFTLFPELQQREGRLAYGSARQSLKAHEAKMLRQTMAAE